MVTDTTIKKGYKQTEVGVIPEDWVVKTCADLCLKIQDGTHFSPKLGGTDYLYITSRNIGRGVLDISDADQIDAIQHNKIYSRCDVKKGDLLLTKDGVNTGNVAINNLNEEFSLLSSVAFLRFSLQHHEPRFFLQFILSNTGLSHIKELMSGNAITRLTLEKIRRLYFPVPTLPEQTAIATVLSDTDALVENLEKLIAKKKAIKQGTMQQLLTGKKRLPGFSGEWEVKKLGEVATIRRGASPRPIDSPNWFDEKSKIGWVRISDVTKSTKLLTYTTQNLSELGIKHSRFVRKGNLIMSICATIGRPILTGIDVCIHDGFVVFTDLKIEKEYLYYFLSFIENDWAKNGQTGSQMNLNTGLINVTQIIFPKFKPEQTAIAGILSDMDAEIDSLEQKRNKYKQIKQGMMQQLLTGKIRLL